jgi:hypothetical protein
MRFTDQQHLFFILVVNFLPKPLHFKSSGLVITGHLFLEIPMNLQGNVINSKKFTSRENFYAMPLQPILPDFLNEV